MKYLALLLLFTSSLFAQEYNKVDANGKKHGVWKGTYEESKRPRYEGTFDHGKEIGMFKFFDDNTSGKVIATREFNSKDNSCYTIFYDQKGLRVSEGKLVNKVYEGEWKYYHENSKVIMSTENYVNGVLSGIRKVYYPNGKIAEETNYINGIKEGIYKKYAENGIALEEKFYKKGEYDGPAVFRSPENLVIAKGKFEKGFKVGIWELNTNGKITQENMSPQTPKKNSKK